MAPASPELTAALAACKALCPLDRVTLARTLLAELGASVSLEAWVDDDFVPKDSAPPPKRPSRKASLQWQWCWQKQGAEQVMGCPWCRRPLTATGCLQAEGPSLDLESDNMKCCLMRPLPGRPDGTSARYAYTTLLYGPSCHSYFLGALVLVEGLRRFGGLTPSMLPVLMHTADVPESYRKVLEQAGWICRQVDYIKDVSRNLFHNWWNSRFIDVFTKLRALQLDDFDKVLLFDLDILVRDGCAPENNIDSLFSLKPPAAMKRGAPVPRHGEEVPYSMLWGHPTRRRGDGLPPHQQASGINAGVMLFRPDREVFAQIDHEVHDWSHPEHYGTYMPEQEYISRLFGTFDQWTHISCKFNFEIDKNERVPHDFTEAHEEVRAGGAPGHVGATVLHYSGTGIKPWDLLYEERGKAASLRVSSLPDVQLLHQRLTSEGPKDRLDGYEDKLRLWSAMLEWLEQFADVVSRLQQGGCDLLEVMRSLLREEEARANEAAAARSAEQAADGYPRGKGQWWSPRQDASICGAESQEPAVKRRAPSASDDLEMSRS
eukprot:TRINITY_DN78850_c0_g1_i1.p1 TRINITY_DN78850_c0_g1~~TRINITY_DN78850_c0_g1_i1.p1  ORF type:complete len:546 (-),score=97.69 TRINITY_DN78850_c0_g1_i1:29-1666(-)